MVPEDRRIKTRENDRERRRARRQDERAAIKTKTLIELHFSGLPPDFGVAPVASLGSKAMLAELMQ